MSIEVILLSVLKNGTPVKMSDSVYTKHGIYGYHSLMERNFTLPYASMNWCIVHNDTLYAATDSNVYLIEQNVFSNEAFKDHVNTKISIDACRKSRSI